MKGITPYPWQIIETDNSWSLYGATPIIEERDGLIHHGHPLKIIKAPKKSREYAEYWPNEIDGEIIRLAPEMLEALRAVDEAFVECRDIQEQQALEMVTAILLKVKKMEEE